MVNLVKIVLNSSEIQALLKSAELADFCEGVARRMTEATGVEYHSDVRVGRYRVRAGVGANSKKKFEPRTVTDREIYEYKLIGEQIGQFKYNSGPFKVPKRRIRYSKKG